MVQARRLAERLGETDMPLLVVGETGTGRRTLAASISEMRKERCLGRLIRFVGFQGLPEELRDVLRRDRNLPREARSMPIVLVEQVDTLDQPGQLELAQVLRERSAMLVATGKGDGAEAASRTLSPDLCGLLEATTIRLPPLRERDEDVWAWAEFFLERACREIGKPSPALGSAARMAIRAHRWPSNLTELDAALRRAVFVCDGPELGPPDLGLNGPAEGSLDGGPWLPLEEAVEAFRKEYVRKALAACAGNRTQTARILKINPRTVFRYLERQGREDDNSGEK